MRISERFEHASTRKDPLLCAIVIRRADRDLVWAEAHTTNGRVKKFDDGSQAGLAAERNSSTIRPPLPSPSTWANSSAACNRQDGPSMRLTNRFLTNAAGLMGAWLVRGWMGSLEFKAAQYDPTTDLASPDRQGPMIYVLWHEYLLFPLYLRGNSNTTVLVSHHRDAEILTRMTYHLGFDLVRGSSYRGGMMAMRELLRTKQMNVAITCDGPRGPRRTLAAGAIYLASKLGMPIVVSGIGYDRPWRMKTWDRFAVPRPGSRARVVTSPAIPIPADIGRDEIEHYRVGIERLLNRLSAEAERWAEAGTAKLEEVPVRREPAAPRRFLPPSIPIAPRKAA